MCQALKNQIREGDRTSHISKDDGDYVVGSAKGNVLLGTTRHDTLDEAKRAARCWSDDVTITFETA